MSEPQSEPQPETQPEPQPEPETVSVSDLPVAEPVPVEPVPEAPVAIEDLLNDVFVIQQKESSDKASLLGVSNLSAASLRPMLVSWAGQGFPNAYPILDLSIQPPAKCSDGVARSLADYIEFVSGKSLAEHVAVLQSRMTGIVVSYAWTGQTILIVVSKA
jgi:hypothetical protein